jgi:hypothetical protein
MQTRIEYHDDLRRLASSEDVCGQETPLVVLFFVIVRDCTASTKTDAMNPSRNLARSSFSFISVVLMAKMNVNKFTPK